MLYSIKTSWIWLKRCGYCRGFGVQSPSAYSFIRYVINEHYSYYAYQDLKERLDMLTKLEHKLGRLLFRLSNFWQPVTKYCNQTAYYPYLYAGCRQSELKELSDYFHLPLYDNSIKERALRQLVVVDWKYDEVDDLLTRILPRCTPETLLIIIGIHRDKYKIAAWRKLKEMELAGITYDLYYCGIVFFDKTVYKQHYKVNF